MRDRVLNNLGCSLKFVRMQTDPQQASHALRLRLELAGAALVEAGGGCCDRRRRDARNVATADRERREHRCVRSGAIERFIAVRGGAAKRDAWRRFYAVASVRLL